MTTGQSGATTEQSDKKETEGQRLLEKVSLETSAAIARRMDFSAIHRLSNGEKMEILPRRDGSTLTTISRELDGTVQTTLKDIKTPMCVIYFCQDAMDEILEEWEIATAQRLRSTVRKLDPEQRRQVREEMRERGDINKQLTERALLIATGSTDPGPKWYYDTIQLHADPPGGDGRSKPAGVAQDTSQVGGREEDAAMKERETVLEEICREVVRDMARRMKLRSIYELRDARQIEVLSYQDGRAHASMRTNPDGTVQAALGERTRAIEVWGLCEHALDEFMKEWRRATAQKLRTTMKKQPAGPRSEVREFLRERYGKSRGCPIPGESLEDHLTMRAALCSVGLPDEDHRALQDLIQQAGDMVEGEIIRKDISDKFISISDWISPKDEPFLEGQYNAMVTHGDVIVEAMSTRLTAARIWWNHMALLEELPGIPGSPEGMVEMIQERIGVTPEEWGLLEEFTTMAESVMPWWYNMPPSTSIKALTCAARATAQVHHPGDCEEYALHIFEQDEEHLRFHEARWTKGNAWEAWVWILKEAVDWHQSRCRCNEWEEPEDKPLRGMGKALEHHIKNDLPWTNRPWAELVLRSRKWLCYGEALYDAEEELGTGAAAFADRNHDRMMREIDREIQQELGLAKLEPLERAAEREERELQQYLIEPVQLLEWTADPGDIITREDAIAIQIVAEPIYASIGESMPMDRFGSKIASVALDSIPPTGRQIRRGRTHWERVNQAVKEAGNGRGWDGPKVTFPIKGFRMTELAQDLREPALACVRRMDEIRSARRAGEKYPPGDPEPEETFRQTRERAISQHNGPFQEAEEKLGWADQ